MSKDNNNFLSSMATSSLARYKENSAILSEQEILDRVIDAQPAEPFMLNNQSFCLIAEIKKTSPSSGNLSRDDFHMTEQASDYIKGKADIISVLTEPSRFSGALDDLKDLSEAFPNVAFMRKDFLVHPYQISEALYYGARGVLLIAAILSEEQLEEMIKRVLEHNMFALIEAFNKEELEQSCSVISRFHGSEGSLMLGVNCRDLKSLEVDFARFKSVAELLPQNITCIAESGIVNSNDISKIVDWGYSGALVGTALMQTNKPESALIEFRKAAQEAQKQK
jgi:indole-3-glycerol phosphate synthase